MCHKGRATSETYTEIAKLLFCISKFAEIKDTRKQLTVAGLCVEAKSLVSQVSMWGLLASDNWLVYVMINFDKWGVACVHCRRCCS